MRFKSSLLLALPFWFSSGCAMVEPAPRAAVTATAETAPVPSREDAADDSAIWVHPRQPEKTLIVATDKRTGLLLYDLHGDQLQYLALGELNNVDLRQSPWRRPLETLIVASQRNPSRVVLLSLQQDAARMQVRHSHPVALNEPYGICLFQDQHFQPYVIVNDKSGLFVQYAVNPDYTLDEVRAWRTGGQPEGCVADDLTAKLYLGEENRGIWQLSARADDPADMHMFAKVGNGRLSPDVEGLALHRGEQTILIASSQGDSSFAVYDTSTTAYLGSFQVRDGIDIDGVSETDGIAVTATPLPGYEKGLLVVQDDRNENPAGNQNFKFVSWADVINVLAN